MPNKFKVFSPLLTVALQITHGCWCLCTLALVLCKHARLPTLVATHIESDMAAETTTAVCEYHGALTAQLYTPQDYLMDTDMASISFPTFLKLPQLILCRNDDYITHS